MTDNNIKSEPITPPTQPTPSATQGAQPRVHKYLDFDQSRQVSLAKEFAVVLSNHYAGKSLSRNQWRKEPRQSCDWYQYKNGGKGNLIPGETKTSKPFHLALLESHILERRSFDAAVFDLPEPFCDWLDGSMTLAPWFHAPPTNPNGTVALTFVSGTPYGKRFPMRPALDREGVLMSSFQLSLLSRVSVLRQRLVENSNVENQADWFEDLRALIGSAISLLDTTLHQLYFKAEYAPEPGWTFDRARLGERHGRKLADKLRWVKAISGRWLHIPGLENSLDEVRRVRNHLQHLDPPMFCFTLEDACRWINRVIDVVDVTWKIRQCLKALPSRPLIELLLSPRVIFVPQDPQRRRIPQPKHVGYGSTSAERLEGRLPAHVFTGEAVFINNIPREAVFAARRDIPDPPTRVKGKKGRS